MHLGQVADDEVGARGLDHSAKIVLDVRHDGAQRDVLPGELARAGVGEHAFDQLGHAASRRGAPGGRLAAAGSPAATRAR